MNELKLCIGVTGATGLVGYALVTELVKLGQFEVVAFSQTGVAHPMAGVSLRSTGNLGLQTQRDVDLVGIHVVVHCVARVHVMQETAANPLAEFRAVNVEGALNLARQAAVAGVKRFVFMSSVKVNGESTLLGQPFSEADAPNPQDAYGQSKCEAEQGLRQIAAETGMEVVIIRPPLVYGPGVKANFASLMRAVQRGYPLPLGSVHNQRSLVALDNLVDFIITCATLPQAANQTFLVSDGQDLSTIELIRGLAHAVGVTARLLPVPVPWLHAVASLLGKADAVDRLCGNLQVDISKARKLLAWTPPVTVDEGLRRTVLNRKN